MYYVPNLQLARLISCDNIVITIPHIKSQIFLGLFQRAEYKCELLEAYCLEYDENIDDAHITENIINGKPYPPGYNDLFAEIKNNQLKFKGENNNRKTKETRILEEKKLWNFNN